MKTRGLHTILWRGLAIAGITVVAMLLLSAVKNKDAKPCTAVKIHYLNLPPTGFMREAEVLDTVRAFMETDPVGVQLQRFDLRSLEQKLEQHPWIYDAQLYFDNTQVLHIRLEEATPVARVIDANGNHFYLDEATTELPLSPTFRADLPVFTGVPVSRDKPQTKKTLLRICQLAKAITKDTFWLAQAAQIDVIPGGKMEMIPTIGNHVVELGYATEPEEMLQRLKYYYRAMAAAGKLDAYSRINASFDRQIVGQRTAFDVARQNKRDAMTTYQKIVQDNKTTVDANSVVNENGAGRLVKELPEKHVGSPPAKNESKPELRTTKDETPAPARPPDKPAEKRTETKEEKIPKAVMPKTETN
ncbi:MAG TPA: hypothetical protein VK907_12320 [Phnomibacter sp.]|nr:hypothetical protein [Phnomibacter sp.]